MVLEETTLAEAVDKVGEVAAQLGLRLHPTHFELVTNSELNRLASYGGMPVRYRHWAFGKEWGHYQTAYDYRRSRIYEMVVNHEPCYAFLDRAMPPAQALLVIAHVLAHVAYFKSHFAFRHTADDQIAIMCRHRRVMEGFMRSWGEEAVERLVDAGLVLADYTGDSLRVAAYGETADDVLGYAARFAPSLLPWQRQVLGMIHQEARYFWPQVMTKIGNEGFATFWHRRILRAMNLQPAEVLQVAKMNAELVQAAPPTLNPYRIGYVVVDRAFQQDGESGLQRVQNQLTDVELIRQYCHEREIRLTGVSGVLTQGPTQRAWLGIKERLLKEVEHGGLPYLEVEPEETTSVPKRLRLRHRHTGTDLNLASVRGALGLVAGEIWHGEVSLTTRYQSIVHVLRHDGVRCYDETAAETRDSDTVPG